MLFRSQQLCIELRTMRIQRVAYFFKLSRNAWKKLKENDKNKWLHCPGAGSCARLSLEKKTKFRWANEKCGHCSHSRVDSVRRCCLTVCVHKKYSFGYCEILCIWLMSSEEAHRWLTQWVPPRFAIVHIRPNWCRTICVQSKPKMNEIVNQLSFFRSTERDWSKSSQQVSLYTNLSDVCAVLSYTHVFGLFCAVSHKFTLYLNGARQ